MRALSEEAAEDHAAKRWRCRQGFDGRRDRNARRAIGRKAINAGGNRRKGDRGQIVVAAKRDGAAITGGEQLVFAALAAIPDWSNRVNDMAGSQPIAFADLGVAGLATTELAAFLEQPRPGRAMDRPIHAAPAEQRGVSGVDDGIDA